ncbi:MAG: hypothetical protein ABFS38_18220 [Bacteroidota bacterium]
MKKRSSGQFVFFTLFAISATVSGQKIGDYRLDNNQLHPMDHAVKKEVQFNGYTNHWQNSYDEWYRYGNLFKMALPRVEPTILQNKVDMAAEMGIPGLLMQEGFMNAFLAGSPAILDQPDPDQLEDALSKGDVLVFLDPGSEVGERVMSQLPSGWEWPRRLKSHQYEAVNLVRADAFLLKNGESNLFVVSSSEAATRLAVRELMENTRKVVDGYHLKKGWFGAWTLQNSVTCQKGHMLEVLGAGMNEGNSWIVYDGYMDFLLKDQIDRWMKDIELPVVTDVGNWPVYGCKDYDGLQVQQMYDHESWIKFAHEKEGYVFRRVWDTVANAYDYDGYLGIEGNKEQIDNEDLPFVVRTHRFDEHNLKSMVLFVEKDQAFTKESMWEAILDRRATGVLEHGKMVGPARYRNALQMLLLDRVFLEDYFSDHIDLKAEINGYDLQVTINNFGDRSAYGDMELSLPAGVSAPGRSSIPVDIFPKSSKVLHVALQPGKEAMDYDNPIGVHFNMNGKKKSTLAVLDLPPVISAHRLLYGHAPKVEFPVSVHNYSKDAQFPVELKVFRNGKSRPVYKATKSCAASTGTSGDLLFELNVSPGDYEVKVAALGTEYVTQLGVGKSKANLSVSEVDLNGDGIMEYRMENDSVRITLLATGARVIEYIVKSRNDNVLFKIWPEKDIEEREPFRNRAFYPYGGFEDFLGQASIETHHVYDVEVVKKEGDYVRVKMWANYFGNRLEKSYTLYGNSPLLEARFALKFNNFPEQNMLAPQPILALGEKHWTEDLFTVPTLDGLKERRIKIDTMYGEALDLAEGWNAGYDTEEDVAFVGAYPVDQLLFLHMWMNTDQNWDSHHYYTEFQPWLFIDRMNTTYFTFYLWGAGGPWENGVKSLREKNLITIAR